MMMGKHIRFNLPYLRATHGKLTQRAVSEATGIGQKTLSALETGASKGIEFKTLITLCEYFKCSPNELFVIEEDPDFSPPSEASLAKADLIIGQALQRAMKAPSQSPEEIWAEFDALREKLQSDTKGSK